MRYVGHAVIVTPQLPHAYHNGGIGTFAWCFARILREAGHDVTIVYTEPLQYPKRRWQSQYSRLGIELICLQETPIAVKPGYSYVNALSEHVSSVVPRDADVVYFADWRANGLHFVRSRRFTKQPGPLAATILHGSTQWDRYGQKRWPRGLETLTNEFYERYAVEHGDVVIAASAYMLDWARAHWQLPPGADATWQHLPFLPDDHGRPPERYAKYFGRLVFFGRLESRKGFDLLVEALVDLADDPVMLALREIVLLGADNVHPYGTARNAANLIEQHLGVAVKHIDSMGSAEAQKYLADNRADSLVLMPSRFDNLPYAVIEASLIRGLNVLTTRVGGIPEIFGDGACGVELTEPYRKPFREALRDRIARGPAPDGLAPYPWERNNAAWAALHERLVRQSRERRAASAHAVPNGSGSVRPRPFVDVCIPHHDLGPYLTILLESLENQTFDDFSVTVIDDGSTDAASLAHFEAARRRYEPRGWRFVRTPNAGVCAARNAAARHGTAPYVIFMDADNVALPTMVEDFVSSIEASGDDCLTCHMYLFRGEGSPLQGFDEFGRPLSAPLVSLYVPNGNSKELGLLSNPFGDGNFIMKRSVFEELGGFDESWHKDVGLEDQELLTLLSLRGYKLDIIPRVLFYYRFRESGRNNTSDTFENECRIAAVYEKQLATVGLEGLASVVLGLYATPLVHSDGPLKLSAGATPFENARAEIWRKGRPAGDSAPAIRSGDVDFGLELKWTGAERGESIEPKVMSALGFTIPVFEMHPSYQGMPSDVHARARIGVPQALLDRQLFFAVAMHEAGRGLGNGVRLRFSTADGRVLETLSVGVTEPRWKLVAIALPAALPEDRIEVAIEPIKSSDYCTTFIATIGATIYGIEQRAGFARWLGQAGHAQIDSVERFNLGVPFDSLRDGAGKPLTMTFLDRNGAQLRAIHMHASAPELPEAVPSVVRLDCREETSGADLLFLWTLPTVPKGLYRVVEVRFSIDGELVQTFTAGAGFGEEWKAVWLKLPEFLDKAKLQIEVLPLSTLDYCTFFIAPAGYRKRDAKTGEAPAARSAARTL